MGVFWIRHYRPRCDEGQCDQTAGLEVDDYLDAESVLEEVEARGWLVKGKKLYCPKCREKYEAAAPREG